MRKINSGADNPDLVALGPRDVGQRLRAPWGRVLRFHDATYCTIRPTSTRRGGWGWGSALRTVAAFGKESPETRSQTVCSSSRGQKIAWDVSFKRMAKKAPGDKSQKKRCTARMRASLSRTPSCRFTRNMCNRQSRKTS